MNIVRKISRQCLWLDFEHTWNIKYLGVDLKTYEQSECVGQGQRSPINLIYFLRYIVMAQLDLDNPKYVCVWGLFQSPELLEDVHQGQA